MKVGNNYNAFNVSAKGLSVQRKKMDIIAENIANAETTRTKEGTPYKRKFMRTTADDSGVGSSNSVKFGSQIKLLTTQEGHIMSPNNNQFNVKDESGKGIDAEIIEDVSTGEYIFMPNHPDADPNGYVETSNVNIINEMVSMIEATRNYEANLTALKASKEMAKDSLEI